MDFPYGETVTRLRATATVDPYSGEVTGRSWTTPDSLNIPGCAFDPGSSSQPVEVGREPVLTKPTLYAPAGADILPDDRLVIRGVTYEVDGDVADWRSPFTGWRPGAVVPLKRMEG